MLVLAGLLIAIMAALLLRLMVGEPFGWPTGMLLEIRAKRVVLAIVVGAALSTAGVGLQSLLRNPLAEPYILGLSSGAAVGVMLQMLVGVTLGRQTGASHTGALLGALLSMAVVYAVSRRRGVLDPLGLLLVGVVLSTINGAIIMLLRSIFYPPGPRNDVARWMMGFLNESLDGRSIVMVTVLTAAGIAVLLMQSRAMDASGFSDAEALSVGVNLPRLRQTLFVVSGILSAGAVVLAGPIAFVGLICPHVARLLLGPAHRTLLIGAALAGALLIVLADSAAVLLDFGQGRMPIGIFTAMIGGPAFLWMLRPYLGRGVE